MKRYRFGKYPYFDKLVYIHNTTCKDITLAIIRSSELEIKQYNDILKNFFEEVLNNEDLDFILDKLLNLCGYLWMSQPFYDGNTRTIISFMKFILKKINYDIDFNDNSIEIPLFYEEKDKCNEQQMLKLKKILIRNSN